MAERHLHPFDRARAGFAALQTPAILVRLHKLLVTEPIQLVPGALAAVRTRQKLQWVACADFEIDDGVQVGFAVWIVVITRAFEATQLATVGTQSCGVESAVDELCGDVGAGREVGQDLLEDFEWEDGQWVDLD